MIIHASVEERVLMDEVAPRSWEHFVCFVSCGAVNWSSMLPLCWLDNRWWTTVFSCFGCMAMRNARQGGGISVPSKWFSLVVGAAVDWKRTRQSLHENTYSYPKLHGTSISTALLRNIEDIPFRIQPTKEVNEGSVALETRQIEVVMMPSWG